MMVAVNTLLRHLLRYLLAAFMCAAATSQAAPPGFNDSIAQRTLACTACHGKEGRAAADGYYPRIAGKPAGYLYHQLLNFRENRRHYGLMTQMVDPLSDAYLMEIAEYFSSLDLPYPAPQPVTATQEVLRRGGQLVTQGDPARQVPACAQCHGTALTGVAPNIPGLLGLPRDYLNAQLGAWRTGQRRAHAPDCMAAVANQLTQDDIHAVTSWLAAQAPPADAHPAKALPPLPPGARAITCGSTPLPQPTSATAGARP
jgi:cytochrome c553